MIGKGQNLSYGLRATGLYVKHAYIYNIYIYIYNIYIYIYMYIYIYISNRCVIFNRSTYVYLALIPQH